MRRLKFRLGALLLGAGLILVVFKGDDFVSESTVLSQPLPAALTSAPMLNWTSAAPRFAAATVIERKESLGRVLTNAATPGTPEKVVVEVAKIQGKYPFIRVETHFKFDAQAQAWVAQTPIEYVADQVLVEVKPGSDFTNALANVGGQIVLRHETGDSTLVLIGLPKATIDAVPDAIKQLTKFRGTFAVVEPHFIRRASRTPNDLHFD